MIGRVAALWRYPVKSMLGEALDAVDVDAAGPRGDRRLAVQDRVTGRVASAKQPRLWRDLLTVRAAGTGPTRLELPDGRTRSTSDPDVDDVLSELLGRPVGLIDTAPADASIDRAEPEAVLRAGVDAVVPAPVSRLGGAAPAGSLVDFAPVHIVASSTLERLRAAGADADPVRYRPNLVVETGVDGFCENDWVGRELRVGDELVLRVLAPTPRCAVPTLAHGGLSRDPEALRAAVRLNRVEPVPGLGLQPCVGAYATVIRPGRIVVGDPLALG